MAGLGWAMSAHADLCSMPQRRQAMDSMTFFNEVLGVFESLIAVPQLQPTRIAPNAHSTTTGNCRVQSAAQQICVGRGSNMAGENKRCRHVVDRNAVDCVLRKPEYA